MDRAEFFTTLCGKFGWLATPWRLAVFDRWADQEGMPFEQTWNPLATTQPGRLNTAFNVGYGPGNWNSVPVRVYADMAAGIDATYQTLTNGYYPNILRCFEDQRGYPEARGPRDFTSWVGNDAYGQRVIDFMNSTTASKVPTTLTVEQRLERIEWALTGRGGDGATDTLDDWNLKPDGSYTGFSLIDGYWLLKGQIETVAQALRDYHNGQGSDADVIASLQRILDAAKAQQGEKK